LNIFKWDFFGFMKGNFHISLIKTVSYIFFQRINIFQNKAKVISNPTANLINEETFIETSL